MTEPVPRLLTLAEACALFGGYFKPATLKAQAERGNLVLTRIGKAALVTEGDLRDMLQRCRVQAKDRSCSGTDELASAQAAARQIAEARKKRPQPNSSQRTSRT